MPNSKNKRESRIIVLCKAIQIHLKRIKEDGKSLFRERAIDVLLRQLNKLTE